MSTINMDRHKPGNRPLIPRDTWQKASRLARADGRSVTQWIVRLIEQADAAARQARRDESQRP